MRVRLWIQQRHKSPCASSKFQGIGCLMIGGEGDGLEVVEKLLEEEMLVGSSNHLVKVMLMRLVILVKSINNCFDGMMLIFGLLETLEIEALVEAMEVYGG
ncbi:hypothetical protein Tco_1576019 [Tanacetum coccineum]